MTLLGKLVLSVSQGVVLLTLHAFLKSAHVAVILKT